MLHQRIRFVTAHYTQLQGLRLVPLGVFVLLVGVGSRGWLDWLPGRPISGPSDPGVVWGPLGYVIAIAGALAATDFYRSRYGAVVQNSRRRRNWMLGLAIVAFFLLAQVDVRVEWPVRLSFLLISASLFVTVAVDGWVRAHYLVGAIAWLVVSFMPVFNPDRSTVALAFHGAAGLTLIVCGVGDHLLVTRTMLDTGKAIDASDTAAV